MKKLILFSLVTISLLGIGFAFSSGYLAQSLFSHMVDDFSEKTVTSDFLSYMTQVKGARKLQLTELNQMEVLTKKSRKLIFWNKLELPPVVIALEVPVQYTYYVDLSKNWSLTREGNTIEVIAPFIEFNPPAANVSEIQFRLQKKSLFRNEESVKTSLLRDLTPYLEERAKAQTTLIKETARKELEELIASWVQDSSAEKIDIIVVFSDEVENPRSDQK